MAYDPNTYLNPQLNALRGRGGRAVGGATNLGAVRPDAPFTPTTQMQANGRNRGRALGLSPIIGIQPGNYSGGGGGRYQQQQPRRGPVGDPRPTFSNSDAYFRARGSGLDYLTAGAPSRGLGRDAAPNLGAATYGGRAGVTASDLTSPDGTKVRSGDQVIDFTTGQNLDADNPADGGGLDANGNRYNPLTPSGRYEQMGRQSQALLAQGLEDGNAAVEQLQGMQNTPNPASGGTIAPTSSGTGRFLSSPYGQGSYYANGAGMRKSFGATGASTPAKSALDDAGERAIASQRANPTAQRQRRRGESTLDYFWRRSDSR